MLPICNHTLASPLACNGTLQICCLSLSLLSCLSLQLPYLLLFSSSTYSLYRDSRQHLPVTQHQCVDPAVDCYGAGRAGAQHPVGNEYRSAVTVPLPQPLLRCYYRYPDLCVCRVPDTHLFRNTYFRLLGDEISKLIIKISMS